MGPPGTGQKKQVGATWADKEAVSEEATFSKQAVSDKLSSVVHRVVAFKIFKYSTLILELIKF